MQELVYPWNYEKPEFKQCAKPEVWGDLYNNNTGCLKYRTLIPDARVIKIVHEVYQKLEEKKGVIVACDSIKLLQVFAEVLPMVYSLTTWKRSYLADTEKLIGVIDGGSKQTYGEYLKNSYTEMEKLRYYPLLVWNNVLANHRWSEKYSGGIISVLQERIQRGGLLVITHVYSEKFTPEDFSVFLDLIRNLWGNTIKSIIYEMSDLLVYKVLEEKKFSCVSREL